MATQEFTQSRHFNTFECLSGYYQLRWKNDVIISDPGNEDYYDKKKAMDIFNSWTCKNEDKWSNYELKFYDKNSNEIYNKPINANNDKEAIKLAEEIFANDMMNTDNIIVFDWQANYVYTIN